MYFTEFMDYLSDINVLHSDKMFSAVPVSLEHSIMITTLGSNTISSTLFYQAIVVNIIQFKANLKLYQPCFHVVAYMSFGHITSLNCVQFVGLAQENITHLTRTTLRSTWYLWTTYQLRR